MFSWVHKMRLEMSGDLSEVTLGGSARTSSQAMCAGLEAWPGEPRGLSKTRAGSTWRRRRGFRMINAGHLNTQSPLESRPGVLGSPTRRPRAAEQGQLQPSLHCSRGTRIRPPGVSDVGIETSTLRTKSLYLDGWRSGLCFISSANEKGGHREALPPNSSRINRRRNAFWTRKSESSAPAFQWWLCRGRGSETGRAAAWGPVRGSVVPRTPRPMAPSEGQPSSLGTFSLSGLRALCVGGGCGGGRESKWLRTAMVSGTCSFQGINGIRNEILALISHICWVLSP